MATLKKVMALMACALVACFVIAGCGAANYKQDFIGTWEICEMEENGEKTSQEDLDLLRKFNLNVTLELTEDNAVLDLFGETKEGTWEAKASKSGTITFDESTTEMTISDEGVLELTSETSVLRFKKVEAAEVADAEGDAAEADAAEQTDDGMASKDAETAEEAPAEEAPAEDAEEDAAA